MTDDAELRNAVLIEWMVIIGGIIFHLAMRRPKKFLRFPMGFREENVFGVSLGTFCLLIGVANGFGMLEFDRKEGVMRIHAIILTLLAVGSGIVIVWGELMHAGFGRWLTEKRGERWVKEIDYVYIGLAAVGVLVTMNRLEFVDKRFEQGDLLGLLAVTAAVAVRLTKTRIEANEWHKPQ